MKISKGWLKDLVDLKVSMDELVRLLPLRTIGTKEVTEAFIELDMKGYNRADLLSLRGVAYEVSAISDSSVKFDESEDGSVYKKKLRLENVHELDVQIEDKNLSPLYSLAKITGLKVGASPKEWVKKLTNSGVRSINNIADVTNLVMFEFGQPLHAFDANEVKDEKIIVRTAKKGEELITLDNKKRVLEQTDLLITDSDKALGLAGVMGGKNSEVSSSTTTILLEAAIFDPKNLRKTATRLGLQSEASKRFYHGLTQKRLFQALNAAIKMYEDLGGKLDALSIVGEYPEKQKEIMLNQEKINSLIGIDIKPEDVESYLKKLHFEVKRDSTSRIPSPRSLVEAPLNDSLAWIVVPPYWRLDVEIEEDVIEEIARMYGYEKIPAKKLEGVIPEKVDQLLFNLIHNIKNELVRLGLTEVQTYPYFSTAILDFWDKNQLVRIANPISAETEYLRYNLNWNLVEVASRNLRNGFDDISIFEVGKVYRPQKNEQPDETYHLSIVIIDNSDNAVAKILHLIKQIPELKNVEAKLVAKPDVLDHPKRFWDLYIDNKLIGFLNEAHPRFTHKFGIEKRVATLEIDFTKLL